MGTDFESALELLLRQGRITADETQLIRSASVPKVELAAQEEPVAGRKQPVSIVFRMPALFTFDSTLQLSRDATWKWTGSSLPVHIYIDATTCHTVSISTLVMTAAWADYLRDLSGGAVEVFAPENSKVARFAYMVGLPHYFSKRPLSSNLDRNRSVPITKVSSYGEISSCIEEALRVLKLRNAEIERALHYTIQDCLRNVFDHSESGLGATFGVQQNQDKSVEVSIADCGVGILETLRRAYPELQSDREALELATQPHVSGTFPTAGYASMRENAGLGLFIVREVLNRSDGKFSVVSGSGFLRSIGYHGEGRRKSYAIAPWQGTVVLFKMFPGNLVDFDMLMERLREAARRARKQADAPGEVFIDAADARTPETAIMVSEIIRSLDDIRRFREQVVLPAQSLGEQLDLRFDGIHVLTQSDAHALFYEAFKRQKQRTPLFVGYGMGKAVRSTILFVSSYAGITQ